MIVERPECNKLTGFYLGTVVWHMPHGQLKVFIQGVYPEQYFSEPARIPTATQMVPLFGGNSEGSGCFSYPKIGATVVCSFLNGDQNFPIVIGAMQGGANSYNQYNYVKHMGELSAERHMVTTGNTHVRLHDDGQVNILIQRPYDNDAEVDFAEALDVADAIVKEPSSYAGNTMESLEKYGIKEPVKEQIENRQISSQSCRFSINDVYNFGAISSSQHYYDSGSDTAYWQPIILSSLATSSMQAYTEYNLTDRKFNNEQASLNLSSVDSFESSFSSVDYYINNICRQNYKTKRSSSTDFDQILGSHTVLSNGVDFLSSFNQIDTQLSIYKTESLEFQDEAWLTMSAGVGNSFGQRLRRDETLNSATSMKTDSESLIDMRLGQIRESSVYKYNADVGTVKDIVDHVYSKDVDLVDGAGISTSLVCEKTKASSMKYSVECHEVMDAENGYIEVYILNHETAADCRIRMNKKGVVNVDASEELNLNARKISLSGDQIYVAGTKLQMAGSTGDCKIGTVSLINHVHTEMQAGDVVVAGSVNTKTAIVSN